MLKDMRWMAGVVRRNAAVRRFLWWSIVYLGAFLASLTLWIMLPVPWWLRFIGTTLLLLLTTAASRLMDMWRETFS